jgi:hypothetical protein
MYTIKPPKTGPVLREKVKKTLYMRVIRMVRKRCILHNSNLNELD